MPKQYLTVKEVARILGVSPLTIRNWDQRGRLVAHRNPLNNYRLYKVTDVENLMKEIETSRGRKPEKIISPVGGLPPPEPPPRFRKLEVEME